jgi:hypothetical protein
MLVTVCALVFLSCKSDTAGPIGVQSISGRTTIDSTTGYGFSFARGTPQPVPQLPTQDSVDDFDAGYNITSSGGPTVIGVCFWGYTENMFHLVRWFGTSDSAQTFFSALSEIADTSFIQNTCGGFELNDTNTVMRVNQIWSVQTRHGKFAKMLILNDTAHTVTIDWVYQPSGSRRF